MNEHRRASEPISHCSTGATAFRITLVAFHGTDLLEIFVSVFVGFVLDAPRSIARTEEHRDSHCGIFPPLSSRSLCRTCLAVRIAWGRRKRSISNFNIADAVFTSNVESLTAPRRLRPKM